MNDPKWDPIVFVILLGTNTIVARALFLWWIKGEHDG